MLWKTLAAGVICALVLAAAASGAGRLRTLSLNITIAGAGTVKVSDKPSITCTSTCHRTLHIKKSSRVTLVSSTGKTLWKSGRWEGACRGTAAVCRLRMTRNRRVTATFARPGTRTNPFPRGGGWPIGNGWFLRVWNANQNADGLGIDNSSGMPAVPASGAQFVMIDLTLSYYGGGSAPLKPLAANWFAEGSHNVKYNYLADSGCGPSANVSLPGGDLQPLIQNNQQVSSTLPVGGNICLQVASNDASTLLFNTGYPDHLWFSLVGPYRY